jgi:hypothetical protein
MTDWRALCAELLAALENAIRVVYHEDGTQHISTADSVIAKADAALSQPAPAGEVSDEDLRAAFYRHSFEDFRQRLMTWQEFHAGARAAIALDRSRRAPVQVAEALAARPLLEQVAPMGDRIGQHTVAEIMVISDRAAAWLRENPPGQPVAIEPHGCPIPGACACVEPAPPTEGEVAELAQWLRKHYECALELGRLDWAEKSARAADLLERQQPVPVPVSERPWERDGWCDEQGRCWLRGKVEGDWRLLHPTNSGVPQLKYCFSHSLPFYALPIPRSENV